MPCYRERGVIMAVRSKKIDLHITEHFSNVNPENIKLMERYQIDLSLRDRADTTKYQYETNIKQWFVFILLYQNNRSVLELTDDDITEFLFWCKNQGNNTMRMKVRTSVISSFYKFLRKKKLIATNPTEFIESPKKSTPVVTQTFLTTEQVALMREKLIEHGDAQLRLYAMISLSTMARVNAIASIRWNQIDLQNCVIHDVLEKESKVVDIFFNDEAKQLLLNLRQERAEKQINDYGWLFYTYHITADRHICKSTLTSWCHQIGKMIGVPTLHPHDFRHSGATLLRNAGMNLEDVSILLNHESTGTTLKYYIKQDKARINAIKSRFNY